VTDLPWGVVFPRAGPEPRHPSQLYEAFLEGVVLFCLLWWLGPLPSPAGLRLR
jgi:phosphatidylglycerol:prolipoprotein diacylglycerol transferase